MGLSPGSRLGPYEIVAPLGAGGMGVVYRARDIRLGREVALKFLPDLFAADPERHARFEREAKLLASLNNANIATLYGLEHLGSQHALVMELVEGEGLDERIARGPVPLDEALPIALQIADALEAAHEKGIVHRDLKPANVKVRPDGTVKVLDFGLAKAWEEPSPTSDLGYSPTITGHHTQAGVILGTAAYMSPEQTRGKPVDKRADIWAFGCVVFELLSGRCTFGGETVSDTLAAILTAEPDWSRLPPAIPAEFRRVLERCLERDPRRRFRDIGDVRAGLEDAASRGAASGLVASVATAAGSPLRRRLSWFLPPLAAAAGIAVGALIFRHGTAGPALRASLLPPANGEYYLGSRQPGPVSISPDGTRIAFAARDEEHSARLFIRNLDSLDAAPLAGTSDASYPFWSPNGRSVGFFADGKLKRVDVSGGSVMTLCDAPFGKGGSWNEDGVIVFAPSYNTPIFRVPAQGGAPTAVTRLVAAEHQNSQRFPQFLPDGRHFLFLTRVSGQSDRPANQVLVGSLGGGEPTLLFESAANVAYASGYLLYTRERLLLARKFDPERMRFGGGERTVAENVGVIPAAALAIFSVSRNGVLVYGQGSGVPSAQLVWLDRQGRNVGPVGPTATYEEIALAPDGRHLAATVQEPTSGQEDMWIIGAERGIPVRLTVGRSASLGPVWLVGGREVVFRTRERGFLDLYRKTVDEPGDARLLLGSDADKEAMSASPDGRFLAYRVAGKDTGMDVWMLPLAGGSGAYPFLQSRFDEEEARFSPDGKWLAFQSNESGRNEVYVTAFPHPGERLRVSSDGGVLPRWSRDGNELFFRSEDLTDLMAVQVAVRGASIALGKPARLFRVAHVMAGAYDTWGGRFLFIVDQEVQDRTPLSLVVNWPSLAQRGGE